MFHLLQHIPKNSISAWLLVFVTMLISACSSGESRDTDTAPSPEYVQIQSIEASTVPIPIYVTGKLSSASEFDLSFRTGGFINELYFDEGDDVRKGDVLAKLDRTEINAQVVRAQNLYEKYRRDLNRIQNLYQDNAATLEQVDDLKTAVENARAELDIARFNQKRSVITAPVNGRILAKYVEINEQVSPGEPIFRLGENGKNSTVLRAGVSDRNITRLAQGDSAEVYFDAMPGQSFTGHVSRIAGAANQRTGVFTIEITLKDPALELRNGFVAKAIIYPTAQQPYITIPINALVEAQDEYVYIYVPDAEMQSAVRVRVKPIHIGNKYFSVALDDLPNQSNVITRGAAYLRPGTPITLAGEGN